MAATAAAVRVRSERQADRRRRLVTAFLDTDSVAEAAERIGCDPAPASR